MAIGAKVAWKSSERHTGGPYWVMVGPIDVPLGSPQWPRVSIGSGIEVILAIANKDGVEMPGTRVKILGYRNEIGGKVNGVEVVKNPTDWSQLGEYKAAFYRDEPHEDFADDLQALLRFNREQIVKKGGVYAGKLEKYQEMRKCSRNGRIKWIEEQAGREILDGLDSGLLDIIVR